MITRNHFFHSSTHCRWVGSTLASLRRCSSAEVLLQFPLKFTALSNKQSSRLPKPVVLFAVKTYIWYNLHNMDVGKSQSVQNRILSLVIGLRTILIKSHQLRRAGWGEMPTFTLLHHTAQGRTSLHCSQGHPGSVTSFITAPAASTTSQAPPWCHSKPSQYLNGRAKSRHKIVAFQLKQLLPK